MTLKKVEDLDGAINKSISFTKVAGYVGTLSSRRFDYELFLASVAKLPDVLFVVIGKSDGSHDTDFQIKKMLSYKNVSLINGIPYEKLHSAISFFDICLILTIRTQKTSEHAQRNLLIIAPLVRLFCLPVYLAWKNLGVFVYLQITRKSFLRL